MGLNNQFDTTIRQGINNVSTALAGLNPPCIALSYFKKCIYCKNYLLFTHFHKDKNQEDGLYYYCKECRKIDNNKHRKTIQKRQKRYNLKNKDIINKKHKQYLKDNKDKISKQRKKHYQDNKERLKKLSKEYYKNNKTKVDKYFKEYRENNVITIRKRAKIFRKNNIEYYRTKDNERRARDKKAFVKDVIPKEIYMRDGWICQICKKRVNKKLKWPHPLSASIDHIIPFSKKGTHEPKNVQLAHLICNMKKKDNIAQDQLRIF